MTLFFVRIALSVAVLMAASELARRFPRLGGFILSLPLVSILAMVLSWSRDHDLVTVSRLAREAIFFVVLGLPFFVPLAFADRLGLGFGTALVAGIAIAGLTTAIGLFLSSMTTG